MQGRGGGDAARTVEAARAESAAAAEVWEAPPDESRFVTYARIIRASPWYHKLFLALVVVETLFVVGEQSSLFILSEGRSIDDDAIYF